MKHLAKKKKSAAPVPVILLDVLMAGIILLLFSFFHHVLPAISRPQSPAPAAPTPTPLPVATPEATPLPDNRTEWQKAFEGKFTEETVITENSYKSPQISIEIETVSIGEGSGKITYHVADIYVASPENFATYTANNELEYFSTQDAQQMVADSNAILAINGDFYCYQKSGLLVRNGQVYMTDYAYCDICVMFPDGSVEVYSRGEYDMDELLSRSPVQIWNFGPSLLDKEGKAIEVFNNVSATVKYPNPRAAFGYYEPGHYCFVVVDGRQEGYSAGMLLDELAQLFEDLGCSIAYNMDGGGSAVMLFNGESYSRQSNGADRQLGDILLIREGVPTE